MSMKLITFICIAFIAFQSVGQIRIVPSDLNYLSKWEHSDLFPSLEVGTKILFRQKCAPDLPVEFPNGIILFEQVLLNKESIALSIEFQDTVVKTVTYYLTYDQRDLLKELGYGNVEARATNRKGEWTCVKIEGVINSVIFADKKKITIIKTLIR